MRVAGECDVLVVGGGPAGLASAIELRGRGVPRVLVVERDPEAGGVPRHSAHAGYGVGDLHRLHDGPRYARHYVAAATACGVEIMTATTATEWTGERSLLLTGPNGIREVQPRAVLLATGCRERPRHARLVPGSRPAGVLTTGALQQGVTLFHQSVGTRAVVVGAEHVSFSALLTLAHAGVRTVAMVTEHPRHQTYGPLRLATATRLRVPVITSSRVTRILGRTRVDGVEVSPVTGGAGRVLPCDTVVFTADWIPEHELARRGGLVMDPATRGPLVDQCLRTSRAGVFAAGNLLRGAETADVCALKGRHAADAITRFLEGEPWPFGRSPRLLVRAPLAWISPGSLCADETGVLRSPVRSGFVMRVDHVVHDRPAVVRQDGRTIWTGRPRGGLLSSLAPSSPDLLGRLRRGSLMPGRSLLLPAGWLDRVDPSGADVEVTLGA